MLNMTPIEQKCLSIVFHDPSFCPEENRLPARPGPSRENDTRARIVQEEFGKNLLPRDYGRARQTRWIAHLCMGLRKKQH
jgi:hypothetical protein